MTENSKEKLIPISEIFSSIQGEGPFTGQQSVYIRAGLCPLQCTFCDTKYTWHFSEKVENVPVYDMKQELKWTAFDDLLSQVMAMGEPPLYVFTGGEPMLFYDKFLRLILALIRFNEMGQVETKFQFETSGAVRINTEFEDVVHRYNNYIHYVISPKLSNSGNKLRWSVNHPFIREQVLNQNSYFKFVIGDIANDLPEVKMFIEHFAIPSHKVWLMPEGVDSQSILEGTRKLAPFVNDNGYNLSTRLHTLIWENKRGV